MAKYRTGGTVEDFPVTLETLAQAQAAQMSAEDFINRQCPVQPGEMSAFNQIVLNSGLNFDARMGRVPTAQEVIDGKVMASPGGTSSDGSANTRPSTPESAILFVPAIISMIENTLRPDLAETPNALSRMIAVTENVTGQEFQRVITDFKRPEGARRRGVAQMAPPPNMMLMTASDRRGRIPVTSIGLDVADQVMMNNPINVVALSLQRQSEVQRWEDASLAIMGLLAGDEDIPQEALPASLQRKASSFDTTITADGKLTQAAWRGFFGWNHRIARVDTIITDLDGAAAIEDREGRPIIIHDNGTSPRMNTNERILNNPIPDSVNVFISDDPNWPAHHLLGLDSRYAIQAVNSISANYTATARDGILRKTSFRFDQGSTMYRLYDDAFRVLILQK